MIFAKQIYKYYQNYYILCLLSKFVSNSFAGVWCYKCYVVIVIVYLCKTFKYTYGDRKMMIKTTKLLLGNNIRSDERYEHNIECYCNIYDWILTFLNIWY